jgi:anti-anti-sigma factor
VTRRREGVRDNRRVLGDSSSEIDVVVDEGRATVVVLGDLDTLAARELHDGVELALRGATDRLVLDLGGVTSVDASGLAALVRCHRRGLDAGVEVHFRRASHSLGQRLRQTGLDRILYVVDS